MALAVALGPAHLALAGVLVTPAPPAAVADAYSATEDQVLQVDAPGVMANDNPELASCVIAVASPGLIGTVDLNPSGSFTYKPPANFHGETSFDYGFVIVGPCGEGVVADSPATVTITVAAVNDAPTAGADSFIVLKDRTLIVGAPGVLINDHDIDGDSLTAVTVTSPAHGMVFLLPDGSFSYTPASGYTGPDAFSYKASDGTATSPTRVVTLTVTAIPPVPTPTPIPTPIPTPTAAPTPTPEITADPTPSEEPSPSLEPSASPVETVAPTAAASATPAPTAIPSKTAGGGGVSLPVLLVIVLLVLLVGFGAALYGPRWLAAQRGEPTDDDAP